MSRMLACLLTGAALAWSGGAKAQAPGRAPARGNAPVIAVPFYTPAHFAQGVYEYWAAPASKVFAAQGAGLVAAVKNLCEAPADGSASAMGQAREQWTLAMKDWERLSAVAIGPLLERRSLRQIDFTPTRPELIARAVERAPADAADMERIGTPAKGLPALEYLLWTKPVKAGSPECRYAQQVAADIDREAQALEQGFAQAAGREWDDEAAVAAMSEALNQWVGGLERLRWAEIERPVRARSSGGRDAAVFPRAASAQSAASWTSQWYGLRELAVLTAPQAPRPGAGLVPLETYLRGRGLNPAADKLVQAVKRVDEKFKRLKPSSQASLLDATRELAALKRLAEAEIAPALQVNIGFSDADGD